MDEEEVMMLMLMLMLVVLMMVMKLNKTRSPRSVSYMQGNKYWQAPKKEPRNTKKKRKEKVKMYHK